MGWGEAAAFPVQATDAQVKAALEALGTVRTAAVIRESTSPTYDASDHTDGKTWTVRLVFASAADDPWAPHDGDPPLRLFGCDVSRNHGGVFAEVTDQETAPKGTYNLTIDNAAGSTFSLTTPAGDTTQGISIAASVLFPAASPFLKLRFSALAGYTQGEVWSIYAPGRGVVGVQSETICKLQDVDLSVAASGAYSGASAVDLTLQIDSDTSSPNTFTWESSAKGSTKSAPLAITGSAQALTSGVSVTFASLLGHTAGAQWTISAKASMPSVSPSPLRTLTAFGSTASTAATYVVTIADGTSSPNTFSIDAGAATPMALNGQAVVNGVQFFWSHVTGYFPGQEWTLRVAAGGAVTTIPKPSAPLHVEAAAVNLAKDFVIEIDGEGTGSGGVDTFKVTDDNVVTHTGVPIAQYAVGNTELVQLTLRFFSTTGNAVGQKWAVATAANGTVTVTPSLASTYKLSSALQALYSGLSPSITAEKAFFVRITRAKQTAVANTLAQFEYSVDGAALVTGRTVHAPADQVNQNTELGSGLRLVFDGPSSYGVGQTWYIQLGTPTVTVSKAATVREHAVCSRRGTCSFANGRCTCFSGFAGPSCSLESSATLVANDDPALVAFSSSPTYRGNLLQLSSTKTPSSDFYMLRALAGGTPVFGIRGDGAMDLDSVQAGMLGASRGLTVTAGGVHVQTAGATIFSGGLSLDNGETVLKSSRNVVNTRIETTITNNGASGYVSTLLQLAVTQGPSDGFTTDRTNHRIIEVFDNTVQSSGSGYVNTLLFSMQGNGHISVNEGGVSISRAGLTITDGGLNAATASQADPAASVFASNTSYAGTALLVNAARARSASYSLLDLRADDTSVFSVRGDGVAQVKYGGLEVQAGGLSISSVGLSIAAGGATVQAGGLLVASGGATVLDGGLKVADDGAEIRNAASQSSPVVLAEALHPAFSSDVLSLSVGRAASSAFYLVRGVATSGGAPQTWFSLDGKANMVLGHAASGATTSVHHDGVLSVLGAPLSLQTHGGQEILVKAGDESSAAGGAISLLAGSGTSTHDGGALYLRAGDGSSGAAGGAGGGGAVSILSGSAPGVGGAILLSTAGASSGAVSVLSGHTTTGVAGDVTVQAGSSSLGSGGNLILRAGTEGAGAGAAGMVSVAAGGSTGATAGGIVLSAGMAASGGAGGSTSVLAGASGGGAGGNVLVSAATGTTTDGRVSIVAPSGGINSGEVLISAYAVSVETAGAAAPGSVRIQAGTATAAAGSGGGVSVSAGSALFSSTGGPALLEGGAAVNGDGGQAVVAGGATSGSGAGGGVQVRGGGAAAAAGGDVSVAGGEAGSGGGGRVVIVGGAAAAGGDGGAVSVLGGAAASSAFVGGSVVLQSGAGAVSTSGSVSIVTAAAATAGASGSVTIATGSSASAASGHIVLEAGLATNDNAGDIVASAGSVLNGVGAGGSVSLVAGNGASQTGGSIHLIPGGSGSGQAGGIQLGALATLLRGVFAGTVDSTGKWPATGVLTPGSSRTAILSAAMLGITGYTPAATDVVLVQVRFAHNGGTATDLVLAQARVSGASLHLTVANSPGSSTGLTSYTTGEFGLLIVQL